MLVSHYKGMKYPAEYVTRFFFKEGLHSNPNRVLKLGCGNGNNLMLFYQYGWDTTGVEINSNLTAMATDNFQRIRACYDLKNPFTFKCCDMVDFVERLPMAPLFQVLMLPHSIYYLPLDQIKRLLFLLKQKQVVREGGYLFLTVRTPSDYRYGKGKLIGENSFVLDIDETGEKNCINTFFSEQKILHLLRDTFRFAEINSSCQNYENYQNGRLITNSDMTIWGKLRCTK